MSTPGASRALITPAARRVLMVAGEASGDVHGADFLRALRARVPDLDVFGIGGDGLRMAGMRTIADAGEIATVGLVEGVGRLRALVRLYRALVRTLREHPPDLCVLVDFPEFNLRLARAAKRVGVPVLYYIGPQVWAWRRGRVRTIARRVDRLAVVFPFEPELYAGRACGVEFVGHPLLDRVRASRDRTTTLEAHGLD
ncbi:MAG: lipid-A-disaccharide synthase, partial [Candidatus Binatia bacterium]